MNQMARARTAVDWDNWNSDFQFVDIPGYNPNTQPQEDYVFVSEPTKATFRKGTVHRRPTIDEQPPRKKISRDTDVVIIPESQYQELTNTTSILPSGSAVTTVNAMSTEKKKRLPPREYVATLSEADAREAYAKSIERNQKKRKGTSKRKSSGKRTRRYSGGSRRSYGAGSGSIVYPNVIGRGAYSIGGGVNFGHDDDWIRGGLGGYYNSSPVVSGRGAYNIKRNSLWEGQGPPMIENITNGPVVIRHREYIGDMTCPAGAPSPFNIFFQQPINPGNPEMFPWLHQLAPMFQEWEAVGMVFEIKTMSSDYTSNVSMGTVFAAADYNVQAPAPANKQQLENMEYSQSCKPSCSILMPIECSPVKTVATHLYIAPNLDYNNGDPQFYDLAQVFLGSQGLPNGGDNPIGTIAELWVSYEIILYKPKISIISEAGEEAGWYLGSPTANAPLGSNMTAFQGNQSPFILLDLGAQTITLPPIPNRTYTIDYYLSADVMGGSVAFNQNIQRAALTLSNCTGGATLYPDGTGSGLSEYSDTGTALVPATAPGILSYNSFVQSDVITTDANVDSNNLPTINFGEMIWPADMTGANATIIVQLTGLTYS